VTHKVADPNPNPTPVIRKPSGIATLPDWWGVISGNTGAPNNTNYGDLRFPDSGAIIPGTLLPVAYGQVRVGGTAIQFGSVPGQETYHGRGVIAFCEGEIGSIDAFILQGEVSIPFSNDWGYRLITGYTGAAGQSQQNGAGEIFYGKNVSAFTSVAYVLLDVLTATVTGRLWWTLIPPGDGTTPTFAADVHGLKLYDPRLDSTNGGSGSQRSATPSTWAYSNNPALIVRDMLRRYGHLVDADFDDASFRAAAAACDTASFTCNVAFATETTLSDALAVVLQTCNGMVVSSNGRTGLFLDVPNAGAAVATLSEADGDIWDLTYEWLSARDRYTRVAVSFADSSANYAQTTTPNFDDPGIASGAVPIKGQVVNAPGINTLAAAIILRDYIYNSQAVTFRVNLTGSSKCIALQQGQKIHLTTLKGIDDDFLIVQITGDAQGFFALTVKPYVAGVYGTTPIGGGGPIISPPGDSTVPPPPAAPRLVLGSCALAMDPPRVYTVGGPYGTARWAFSGDTAHDGTKINDGDTTVSAMTTAAFTPALVTLDLGIGITAAFGRFDFWTDSPRPSGLYGTGPLAMLQYSDDGLAWTDALTSGAGMSQTTLWQDAASLVGVYPCHIEIPSSIGAHRWWRLTFSTNAIAHVYEIRASTFADWSGAGAPSAYTALMWPTGGRTPTFFTPDAAQPVAAFSSTLPTDAAPLALTQAPLVISWGDSLGGIYTVWSGAVGTVSFTGVPSNAAIPFFTDLIALPSVVVPPTFGSSGGGVIIEKPAGVIDGTNATFVLSFLPSLPRIMLFVDGQKLIPGRDYTRAAKTVTLAGAANKPWNDVDVIYTTTDKITPWPIPGTPETPTAGSATTWTAETASFRTDAWYAICWSPDLALFCAVGYDYAGSRIMTSPDGVTWTNRFSPIGGIVPKCVAWSSGIGKFVTVDSNSDGTIHYSSDGVSWTSVGVLNYIQYSAIAASSTKFVVLSKNGSGDRAAVSTNGTTWTSYSTTVDLGWTALCWSPGLNLWVAVALDATTGCVGTSPDGQTWTIRNSADALGAWTSICWSPELGLLVATRNDGVMTSPDGVTWTLRSAPGSGHDWRGVCWSSAKLLFVAVSGVISGTTHDVMTSTDGIAWTLQTTPSEFRMCAVCAADSLGGLFVAVAGMNDAGLNSQVMISSS
jgi:hypothetical protein